MVTYSFHLYSRSSISFHSVFHSFHGLMNSINWPASSVWVFIAQLGGRCGAGAEATGSNPVGATKIFFSGYFRNCLNCDSLRWSHTHSMNIYSWIVFYFYIHLPSFSLFISILTRCESSKNCFWINRNRKIMVLVLRLSPLHCTKTVDKCLQSINSLDPNELHWISMNIALEKY